jgi:hypothetical protein
LVLQEITEQDEDEREGEANSREENAANDLAQCALPNVDAYAS